MREILELDYLKTFYERVLKSSYYQPNLRKGCTPEEIQAVIASQKDFKGHIPEAFIEYLKFFGKDSGFRHHGFDPYINVGGIYFDYLVDMGKHLKEKNKKKQLSILISSKITFSSMIESLVYSMLFLIKTQNQTLTSMNTSS